MNIPLWRHGSGVSLAAPATVAAESYRRLRTMVDVAATEHPGVQLVTSPGASGGTTTIVANLGVALSSLERPVLLIDGNLYRDRNKVERFFSRLKQFRRLATRYEKTASSFLGMVHFVSALLWLR